MAILYNGSVITEGTLDDLRAEAGMETGKFSFEDIFLKLTEKTVKTAYLEYNKDEK